VVTVLATPEITMFIVKGRLLGTVLSLLIAALGATLLSGNPPSSDEPTVCAAATAAAAGR
jgi:hypothetical protein